MRKTARLGVRGAGAAALVLSVWLAGVALLAAAQETPPPAEPEVKVPEVSAPAQEVPPAAAPQEPERVAAPSVKRPVRTFQVYADNWYWQPDEIRVKKGDHVVLRLKSFRASRSFLLKGYKIDELLPQDKEVRLEFDADRAGTFPFRCGRPCGDGCAKLRGKLIVEE